MTDTDVDLTLPGGARVASPVIVRVAGLPVSVLDPLRFEESFAAVAAVVELGDRLRETGGRAADSLYDVIGLLPDGDTKAAVVGLRRALHDVRTPAKREWNAGIAAALPPSHAAEIGGWVERLHEYEALRARLPELLSEELDRKRPELRKAAAHPGFRRALSQSGPPLFAALDRWLSDEDRPPRPQSQVRLAKYLARAAMKTSPYSTFTVTGTAAWTGDAGVEHSGPNTGGPNAGGPNAGGSNTVRGVLELSGGVPLHLGRALACHPEIEPLLPLRANPSVAPAGGSITFLGAPPGEPVVTLKATPAVAECLRTLTDEGPCTAEELRARLARRSSDAAAVDRFVDSMIAAGLVERYLPVDDQTGDWLGDLAGWLAGRGHDVAGLLPLMREVRTRLRLDVPVADVTRHHARARELATAVRDLAARLDVPAADDGQDGERIFHENAVFTSPVTAVPIESWRPALADLDVLRRFLAPFDPVLPLRLALGTLCGERFGAGATVPFVVLNHEVQRVLSERDAPASDAARQVRGFLLEAPPEFALTMAGSALPRLRELGAIQAAARESLLSAPAAGGAVHAEPADLAALAATWPAWVTEPRSVGWYVQAVPGDGGPRLVVNVAQMGHGRGRSRALHLIERAGGRAPAEAPRAVGADGADSPLTAELSGNFGSSLNLRTPTAEYEIDYPFTVSARPAGRRIPLGELSVAHDARTDLLTLVWRRNGREVQPVHLGLMTHFLLPPAARLLILAFGATYYIRPGIPWLTSRQTEAPGDVVVAHPRVEIGRVVVRRARWAAPAACVPARTRGESDAEYWLRLAGWLREHGVPDRCFVRFQPRGHDAVSDLWDNNKRRKPVFFDVANWFLVTAFERMLRESGPSVVFEEALPAPDDASGPDPADPSVAEFLVEITGGPRR